MVQALWSLLSLNHSIITWPSNPTPRHRPKGLKTGARQTSTQPRSQQHYSRQAEDESHLSIRQQTDAVNTHGMECRPTVNRNKVLKKGSNMDNAWECYARVKKKTHKDKYSDSTYMKLSRIGKSRDRNHIRGYQVMFSAESPVVSDSLRPQAPLSMGFFRQEYWSGLPCPPSREHPNPGIKPMFLASPAPAGRFFPTVPPGKPRGWGRDKWGIAAQWPVSLYRVMEKSWK